MLYVEEERLLGEFKKVCTRQNLNVRALKIPQKVKDALITASMDDEYFEATKDTCVFLGGKLTIIINMININFINMNDMINMIVIIITIITTIITTRQVD